MAFRLFAVILEAKRLLVDAAALVLTIASMQAPRSSQVEIVKFLRGVTQRIEEEARRGVSWAF